MASILRHRYLQNDVMGVMLHGQIAIKQDIGSNDYCNTYSQLINAIEAGFNSCIVTSNGVYGTKNLTPRK